MRPTSMMAGLLGALLLAGAMGAGAPPAAPPATAPPPASAPNGTPKPDAKPDGKPAEGAAPAAKPTDAKGKYPEVFVVIDTSRGPIRATLAVNALPKLVAHFTNLAERKFYDGLTFHSVARDTQVHSGDPTGSGDGGCGYKIPNQYHKSVLFDREGVLGLWSTDENASSQFFITLIPMGRKYNLREAGIGVVTEGLDVAKKLQKSDLVKSVRIEGDLTALKADFAADLERWNAVLDEKAKEAAAPPRTR